MITFETISKLESATLKEGDLVQVLGEFSEGDVALMTGKVYPALHNSSNRLVTIANGLKVEIFPTPLGDKDVTKKYVNERDDKIKASVNNLHTKREAIEWRSGLRVTDELQLYVHDGVEYLPSVEAVPFTTGVSFNADSWVLSELVTLRKMRTDSASQLGLVYLADWQASIVIPEGAMTAKTAIWHNGQFYSIGTDAGFTSNEFNTDLATGRFLRQETLSEGFARSSYISEHFYVHILDDADRLSALFADAHKKNKTPLLTSGRYEINKNLSLEGDFFAYERVFFTSSASNVTLSLDLSTLSNIDVSNLSINIDKSNPDSTDLSIKHAAFNDAQINISKASNSMPISTVRIDDVSFKDSGTQRGVNCIVVVNAENILISNICSDGYSRLLLLDSSRNFTNRKVMMKNVRAINGRGLLGYTGTINNRLTNLTLDNVQADNLVNGDFPLVNGFWVDGINITNGTLLQSQRSCVRIDNSTNLYINNSTLITTGNYETIRVTKSKKVVIDNAEVTAFSNNVMFVNADDTVIKNSTINLMTVLAGGFNIFNKNIGIYSNTFNCPDGFNEYKPPVWFRSGSSGYHLANVFNTPITGTSVRVDAGATVTTTMPDGIVISKPTISTVQPPIKLPMSSSLNNANAWIVTFNCDDVKAMKQIRTPDEKIMTEIMSGISADVAINFGWATGTAAINGNIVQYDITGETNSRSCVVIDNNNKLSTRDWGLHKQAITPTVNIATYLAAEGAYHTSSFRTPLVVDGVIYDPMVTGLYDRWDFNNVKSARTCIGQKLDGTYVILIVDGVSHTDDGASMAQVAEEMLRQGCEQAYNLDGGGSTTLWYKGAIINSPANGLRKLGGVLYV